MLKQILFIIATCGQLLCMASLDDSIQLYKKLYEKARYTNLDSANHYNGRLITLYQTTKNYQKLENSYNSKASIFIQLHQLDSAKLYQKKAITLCRQYKFEEELGLGYSSLGNIYIREQEFDSATHYLLSSHKILDALGSKYSHVPLLGLAGLYTTIHQPEKALHYIKIGGESVKYNPLKNKEDSVLLHRLNADLGAFYFNTEDYHRSKLFLKRSYQQAKLLTNHTGVAYTALYLSNVYTAQGMEDSMQYYMDEALLYGAETSLNRQLIAVEINNSEFLMKKKKYLKAIERLKKAKELSLKYGYSLKVPYRNLMLAYMSVDADSGRYYFKQYDSVSVANLNEEKLQSVSELEVKYETEKSRLENQLLKKEVAEEKQKIIIRNYLVGGIILFVLVLGIIVVLLYKRKRSIEENKLLKIEQQLFRLQMNPHFIFNSLSTIGSYIRNNQKDLSYEYIVRFSKLMRGILESSREDFILLNKEIEIIESFLFLHKLRLKDKLSYEINIDDNVDVDEIEVAPMMLQPFIENAIEHGIDVKNEAGHVTVNIKETEKGVLLEVIDNGGGFYQNAVEQKLESHKSYAIQITKERIANLRKNKKKIINLVIAEEFVNPEIKGTRVALYLK